MAKPSYVVREAGVVEKTNLFGKKTKVKMFDVSFPRGHSVRISEAELERQGFRNPPPLVDEDGEVEINTKK